MLSFGWFWKVRAVELIGLEIFNRFLLSCTSVLQYTGLRNSIDPNNPRIIYHARDVFLLNVKWNFCVRSWFDDRRPRDVDILKRGRWKRRKRDVTVRVILKSLGLLSREWNFQQFTLESVFGHLAFYRFTNRGLTHVQFFGACNRKRCCCKRAGIRVRVSHSPTKFRHMRLVCETDALQFPATPELRFSCFASRTPRTQITPTSRSFCPCSVETFEKI